MSPCGTRQAGPALRRAVGIGSVAHGEDLDDELFLVEAVDDASLVRRGRHLEMRLDPAWWLTGVTARRAKLEDTGSSDVPNDVYVVEEGHRLLTYVVPATARVTVLTRGRPTALIAVSELAEIVKGRNPKHRRLLEPKAGFWVRVGFRYPGPVLSLDQQFQP